MQARTICTAQTRHCADQPSNRHVRDSARTDRDFPAQDVQRAHHGVVPHVFLAQARHVQRDHRNVRLHVARWRRQRAPGWRSPVCRRGRRGSMEVFIAIEEQLGCTRAGTSDAPSTLLFRAHSLSAPLTLTLKTASGAAPRPSRTCSCHRGSSTSRFRRTTRRPAQKSR
ncbi:hypothetical protein DFH11DRAFT_1592965 [Phellopilus nigrolimitatus]|nr:hypothetical protein DFH11DRAFT_1592965 [Phellopilus nigrolimitatus]